MARYTEHLRYANLTIRWVERALRQERRLQRAYGRFADTDDSTTVDPSGVPSVQWVQAYRRFEDEGYFFIMSVSHAIKGRDLLERRGSPMPKFRQRVALRAWRNVEEHWDDPGYGRPIQSLADWRVVSDERAPGLSFSGADKVTRLSGVRVRWLRQDLRALRQAARSVSEREWKRCYIAPIEAASILGITVTELEGMPYPPLSHDFGAGLGRRYWREWVDARAHGELRPPDWDD